MGNWMTVMVEGDVPADEVGPLTEWMTGPDWRASDLKDTAWERVGPLTISDGLCGLGPWPAETVMRIGNCYERDYTPEEVADHLTAALEVAPGMDVKVHCGGDYEAVDVVATVARDGDRYVVGPPAREKLPPIPKEQMRSNLIDALLGP